jgi:hypothetical protein
MIEVKKFRANAHVWYVGRRLKTFFGELLARFRAGPVDERGGW